MNEKERKAVVKNAADAVKKSRDLMEDTGSKLPKDLPTVGFFSASLSIPKMFINFRL